ncbi:hypothetical protein CIW48_27370 [Methylobacterium sp. P1-11]|uniref:hypothetical protein n=1 Tax=Methylobacterium sp. P1-11 TaxID=2024616 RepID=UPI0011EF7C94|nr:hypothetical protein [Methylobacterium sp. P1-11]KAA0117923.1 hypothetical protein CIW48_27370 [Methylobacterium sp. P1-11]
MTQFNPMKLIVLYAMTVIPMGGVLLASIFSPSNGRMAVADAILGFMIGCFCAAAIGALIAGYVAGVWFLCRSEKGA